MLYGADSSKEYLPNTSSGQDEEQRCGYLSTSPGCCSRWALVSGRCVTYKQEKDTVRGQSAFHDLQKRDARLNLLG